MPAARTVNIAEFAEFDLAPERHARGLHSILLHGLAGVLVCAPLLFGAVEDWSIFALQSAAVLLGVIWSLQQVKLGRVHIAANPLYLPAALFAALIAAQYALGLSAYRYATKQELLTYAAYGILMFVAAQVLSSPAALRRFAYVLAIAGFAIALFAIVQDFTNNGKLYWMRAPRQGGWIFGPYVNHNHFAGLMEMLVPIGLAVALRQQDRGRRALLLFLTTIMAASLLMTQSRAGVTAFVIEMLVFGALVFRRNRRHSGVVATMVGAVIILLVWLNTTQVFVRLQETHDFFRSQILHDGLHMFRLHPIAGWGLGTFPTVYPGFRSFYTDTFINQAHNDVLQLLVETGIVGFALALWFLGMVYRRGLGRAATWDTQPGGLMQLAALTGVSGIVVHSLFDFNLHIPANAALFYVLCVIAAGEVAMKKNGGGRRAAPLEPGDGVSS